MVRLRELDNIPQLGERIAVAFFEAHGVDRVVLETQVLHRLEVAFI